MNGAITLDWDKWFTEIEYEFSLLINEFYIR
jgi:hypothetical protein